MASKRPLRKKRTTNPYRDIARRAAQATDERFRRELSRLTILPPEILAQHFPSEEDQSRLAELIAAVRTSTDEMDLQARLLEKGSRLAATSARLLRAIAL